MNRPVVTPNINHGRRESHEVQIGSTPIGGRHPVAVQSMTNCSTSDTAAATAQISSLCDAGCTVVRLTAQGVREAENLKAIKDELVAKEVGPVNLVADIHFNSDLALIAAGHVDKVRINPGNYKDPKNNLPLLISKCKERGVSLRIGVNHGSLSANIMEKWGNTPRGMVESAMEFLKMMDELDFRNIVISMKSSNVRTMVHAYRLLDKELSKAGMTYPIHLGVTEAGNGMDGRIKSAVGIGAVLADGIGDTIRVSLTEDPCNEIPVARGVIDYICPAVSYQNYKNVLDDPAYSPFKFRRRASKEVGNIGGSQPPALYSELNTEAVKGIAEGKVLVIEERAQNASPIWREKILELTNRGDDRPVILKKRYNENDPEALITKAASDFGMVLLDGLADGIWIENCSALNKSVAYGGITTDAIGLSIFQAARVRMSKTEFIACPGCGRTLYDLENVLNSIKARTGHLKNLKIGVMGCIVNGPGEMADADYGYVGEGKDKISLYKGQQLVRRSIPQNEAIEALIDLIKQNGDWTEPAV